MMDLPDFLTTFFDDPKWANRLTLTTLKDFAWDHLSNHTVIIFNGLGQRVSFPYMGCWILESGVFNPSLYSYKPTFRYYASYYFDVDHIYPVFCLDENGKAF